ncbi:MAG TPA: thioesterase family protein [Phycisphaerales bacterium]|nr:thioesterase family protein [Phycisphaerales bacterium]
MDENAPSPKQIPSEGAFRVRVRYCECDPMGVAHHSAYVPWLEEARTELLRASGVSYAQLEAEGVFLAVVRLETTYRRPARYDDVVEVRVRVVGGSRVKIRHEYKVVLAERAGLAPDRIAAMRHHGEDVLALAATTLACINAEGRPRQLPDWLAARE